MKQDTKMPVEEEAQKYVTGKIVPESDSKEDEIKAAIVDSYSRLISPSIEREIRKELTEKAGDGAIEVFGKNLKQLLMQPPVSFDVGQRSAASIARRVQDPLSELVKIEPRSIGVGQYQHDMNQKKLAETLSGVVEDAVNSVGVDLNTASFSLLSYISGISQTVAKNIVAAA